MRYWRTGWRRPATEPTAVGSDQAWKLAEVEAERDAVAKSAVELAELLRELRRRHELLKQELGAAVADRDMARRVNVRLREELAKAPERGDAGYWRGMWELDRANLVKLERRLAVLEGREQPAAVAS